MKHLRTCHISCRYAGEPSPSKIALITQSSDATLWAESLISDGVPASHGMFPDWRNLAEDGDGGVRLLLLRKDGRLSLQIGNQHMLAGVSDEYRDVAGQLFVNAIRIAANGTEIAYTNILFRTNDYPPSINMDRADDCTMYTHFRRHASSECISAKGVDLLVDFNPRQTSQNGAFDVGICLRKCEQLGNVCHGVSIDSRNGLCHYRKGPVEIVLSESVFDCYMKDYLAQPFEESLVFRQTLQGEGYTSDASLKTPVQWLRTGERDGEQFSRLADISDSSDRGRDGKFLFRMSFPDYNFSSASWPDYMVFKQAFNPFKYNLHHRCNTTFSSGIEDGFELLDFQFQYHESYGSPHKPIHGLRCSQTESEGLVRTDASSAFDMGDSRYRIGVSALHRGGIGPLMYDYADTDVHKPRKIELHLLKCPKNHGIGTGCSYDASRNQLRFNVAVPSTQHAEHVYPLCRKNLTALLSVPDATSVDDSSSSRDASKTTAHISTVTGEVVDGLPDASIHRRRESPATSWLSRNEEDESAINYSILNHIDDLVESRSEDVLPLVNPVLEGDVVVLSFSIFAGKTDGQKAFEPVSLEEKNLEFLAESAGGYLKPWVQIHLDLWCLLPGRCLSKLLITGSGGESSKGLNFDHDAANTAVAGIFFSDGSLFDPAKVESGVWHSLTLFLSRDTAYMGQGSIPWDQMGRLVVYGAEAETKNVLAIRNLRFASVCVPGIHLNGVELQGHLLSEQQINGDLSQGCADVCRSHADCEFWSAAIVAQEQKCKLWRTTSKSGDGVSTSYGSVNGDGVSAFKCLRRQLPNPVDFLSVQANVGLAENAVSFEKLKGDDVLSEALPSTVVDSWWKCRSYCYATNVCSFWNFDQRSENCALNRNFRFRQQLHVYKMMETGISQCVSPFQRLANPTECANAVENLIASGVLFEKSGMSIRLGSTECGPLLACDASRHHKNSSHSGQSCHRRQAMI